MKFLTNMSKNNKHVPINIFIIFKYMIKIYAPSTMKNMIKSTKLLARTMGYKKPKISIYDDATDMTGKDISDTCWAVYVEEK